ncbi:hypothetical protein BaOVIS_032230 [Babesia ovis]|uniref:Uncharacterized protein n=1 Tax=Babesia ovis TaxID=5869 RepID=A0A9W5TCM2_BABOV|nr:hypothetical protein BaOVIS_032230 [Babesia ovis]
MKAESPSTHVPRADTGDNYNVSSNSIFSGTAPYPSTTISYGDSASAQPTDFKGKLTLWYTNASRVLCKYSWFPCVLFYYISLLMVLSTLSVDKWRMIHIDYDNTAVVGYSQTYLGGFDLKRIDSATIGEASIMFNNSLSYNSIIGGSYCADKNPMPMFKDYPMSIDILRRIDQVGLLSPEEEIKFIAKHGRPVYDVLCSGIKDIKNANSIMKWMAIVSGFLLIPQMVLCALRSLYNKRSTEMSLFRVLEISLAVIWTASWGIGIGSSLWYIHGTNFEYCVNAKGGIIPCAISSSAKLFLISSVLSMIAFFCHLLYGKSLKDGVPHEHIRYYRSRSRTTLSA